MIDFKSRWEDVTDKKQWATRRSALMAKVKATQAVWFPPHAPDTGKKATSTAKRATKRTAKKTTKKATSGARSRAGTKG